MQCIENGVESTNLRKTLRFVLEKRTFQHIMASKYKKDKNRVILVGCFCDAKQSDWGGGWKILEPHQPPNFPILELQNGQKGQKIFHGAFGAAESTL